MELSKTLETGAVAALESIEGEVPAIVPIEGTPFYISETGDGIVPHGVLLVHDRKYYVGTLDPDAAATRAVFQEAIESVTSGRLRTNEALSAANAVGDDAIQKKMQGQVVPDSFTHGTSEQRMYWFNRGFKSGDIRKGDTFAEIQ